jgi:ABC-2 type transport system ATP-binding protein
MVVDGEAAHGIGAFPSLERHTLVDPGGDQHIRARPFHEPEIIGVVDDAGQIRVLEIDTQDKMMFQPLETAEGGQGCGKRVHALPLAEGIRRGNPGKRTPETLDEGAPRIRFHTMTAPALRLTGLHKSFDKPVIAGLDLAVRAGELYALLGPNGAGKTTTLRMAVGLTEPDQGGVEIYGIDARRDPRAAKAITAWLPDEPMLYDKLTPSEYLGFVAGLWGIPPAEAAPEAERLLKWLELWDVRDTRCEGFSRGMKQKAALAGALIHDPRLLILDEPLTGLDAAMARSVKDALRAAVDQGKTVIVTTHILDVAERIADRIGIIAGGRLLAEGTLDELRGAGSGSETLEDTFIRLTSTPPA